MDVTAVTEENERKKAEQVRSMFERIAPGYDVLNHLLSLNIDKRWRRFTVRKVSDALKRPGSRALDICCGTADLSLELARHAETCGIDFCHPMLQIGLGKMNKAECPAMLAEGDATSLPFATNEFDAATIAFGLRNVANIDRALQEIYRVLKPGGRAAILEFSHPVAPVFRQLFGFYFSRILPRIGGAVSGSSGAYQYLPDSVKQFPTQQVLAEMMRTVGFRGVSYYNLSFGIAALHLGDKQS